MRENATLNMGVHKYSEICYMDTCAECESEFTYAKTISYFKIYYAKNRRDVEARQKESILKQGYALKIII
jgi:hypothetical protein